MDHPVVCYIVEYAAVVLLNRFEVGADGKTSYERIKGRRCIEPIAEFGELVFFRPAKTKKEKETEHTTATKTNTIIALVVVRRRQRSPRGGAWTSPFPAPQNSPSSPLCAVEKKCIGHESHVHVPVVLSRRRCLRTFCVFFFVLVFEKSAYGRNLDRVFISFFNCLEPPKNISIVPIVHKYCIGRRRSVFAEPRA